MYQKTRRAPEGYSKYVIAKLKELKILYPELEPKQRFVMATKLWKEEKGEKVC